jgi:hypothetical protein
MTSIKRIISKRKLEYSLIKRKYLKRIRIYDILKEIITLIISLEIFYLAGVFEVFKELFKWKI